MRTYPVVGVNKHDWITAPQFNWPFCRICGVVQRRDGQNKPCKGPTRLRAMEGSGDTGYPSKDAGRGVDEGD